MSRSASQLRLEIKSSKVDDVPTFALGVAGASEPLTFCNRFGNSSRPMPLHRPASLSIHTPRNTQALFEDEDDDIDGETDMLLNHQASPVENNPEQRDNLLVSNSASVDGLSNQQTASCVETVQAGNGRNAVKTEQVDRPIAQLGSSMLQPVLVGAKKVRFLGVKQEDTNDAARPSSSNTAETKRMFLGAVKDEPFSPTLTSSSASELSTDKSFTRSDAPSPQPAARLAVPSIVITEAPSVERKPAVRIESAPLSLRSPALCELFSRTGYYTYQCLALIHAAPPCHELLLRFRSLAHYLLQVSQTPKIKLAAKEPKDLKALKQLRDTLKDVLDLTSIVKLDPVAVPNDAWTKATDTCVRRLKKIAALVDRMLRASSPRTLTEPR
ncbi:hypothetical protein PSEUBRA_000011 [Kalmanozyma brasiliensis GHG001]|uniref:uncharacterized protein n=1 Tax=Kalmanozyma brasiliensis (strain GHG001) TaxID=1365824 RepID=UPI002868304E|nr:uncharacterized protein PSEUBRA_000011 [Kalmanozyma brasiliensis GHG001]KAF6766764.1 hypothetical protein PSEUBRA_000011 [Kalmanozyma brasiliensis GHG001]